jgi:Mg-chelatase subunit ChlD
MGLEGGSAGGADFSDFSEGDVSSEPTEPTEPSEPPQSQGVNSRTLTAGIWDDNAYPAHYARYAEQSAQPELSDLPVERHLIRVVNSEGEPVRGAEVRVTAGEQSVTLHSADHGYALYAPAEDGEAEAIEVSVKLGALSVTESFQGAPEGEAWVITLPDAPSQPAEALDVALIVDATGSMGDEIAFLKVEISDIITQLRALYPNLDLRVALTHYRDVGDDYVTRSADFTSDLGELQASIEEVSAGGGGDFPEAMGEAMEESMGLSWREGEGVARVAFVVADAPPQTDRQARTDRAARLARDLGVRIFPIASSGVDAGAEWAMRQMAAFTLGQYIFLTDDSGVGGGHAEPHIPCYEVRLLHTLMLRVIQSAVEGVWVGGDADEVIRSVGFNENGACVGAVDYEAPEGGVMAEEGGAEGGMMTEEGGTEG